MSSTRWASSCRARRSQSLATTPRRRAVSPGRGRPAGAGWPSSCCPRSASSSPIPSSRARSHASARKTATSSCGGARAGSGACSGSCSQTARSCPESSRSSRRRSSCARSSRTSFARSRSMSRSSRSVRERSRMPRHATPHCSWSWRPPHARGARWLPSSTRSPRRRWSSRRYGTTAAKPLPSASPCSKPSRPCCSRCGSCARWPCSSRSSCSARTCSRRSPGPRGVGSPT